MSHLTCWIVWRWNGVVYSWGGRPNPWLWRAGWVVSVSRLRPLVLRYERDWRVD